MKFVSYLALLPALIVSVYYYASVVDFSSVRIKSEDFQDPNLIGPSTACLNGPYVYASFSGGGSPSTDRYIWTITDSNGFEVYYQAGGEDVQEINFPFTSTDVFNVTLRVIRGDNQNFFTDTRQVVVERGPRFVLPPDVIICGDEPVLLQALDTEDPNFSNYSFEWFLTGNEVLGRENTFLATIPGRYAVRVISPACEAVGSTFVGPSIQVDVTASHTSVCFGETVSYTPDSPTLGAWSYRRDGDATRTPLSTSYTLDLNTGDLDGFGLYTIYFNVEDPERPDCSVEKSFELNVQEGAGTLTLVNVQDSDGCEAADGAFEIRTNSFFDAITVSGMAGDNLRDIPAGSVLLLDNLEPKVYTVTGRRGNCSVTRTIQVANTNFEEAIPFTVTATPQTCSPTGINRGVLVIDFDGDTPSGEYRAVRSNGDVYSGSFQNQTRISVEVPAGNYEVEISDGVNCNSTGAVVYEVEGSGQVNFSIPGDITACEFYELAPESSQDLAYTLRRPDGTEVSGVSGDAFMLDQEGAYRLIAHARDTDSSLCPRTRTFDVTINEPLEFDVIIEQIDCFGNQLYTANLFGRDPGSVIVRWYTEDGVIVGRQPVFFPPSTGRFLLEVQPRASSPCEVVPVPFEVAVPIAETEVELTGEAFCEESAFTTLTATMAAPDVVEQIEWFKLDADGERIWLFDYDGQTSIDVADEGVYEVVVRNRISCRLGSSTYTVERQPSPVIDLQDTYEVCSEEGIFPELNPGEFSEVEWYRDGELVSTAATYRIGAPGDYEFRAFTEGGCMQEKSFQVTEGCVVFVRFTNAMIPGNPNRDFRVYANNEIDEVEVFVYQRTGELVFHSKSAADDPAIPVCVWDGLVNGRPLTTDTYPVIIKYRSASLGLDQTLRKSLLVIR